MSALGFVGGLGGFANSFMQGYEKSEDREQLQKDRDQLRKDREFQAQQREYEQGQQRRKMDEQKRADDLRAADSAVQTTETTSAPAEGTVYGNQAQVMRDEDGNLMPGAVETSPAQNVTRQRQWDSIYRDYAANRQKSGDTAGALDFTDKANKLSAQRSANAFMQLQADAGSKTPAELAREIGKIFDADPMNGGTKSIEELPNGGVRMTLYNKDTGKTSTKEFTGEKARERLLADFNAYFRPEAYAKLLDKRIENQDTRTAELLKPYTLRPGEKRQVMGADGKVLTIGEGNLPKGYELVTDESGNVVMRPSATAGKTTSKAPKTSVEEAQELMKDALGKADGSPEGAARYTRAVSYLDGVFAGNPNVSPRIAAAIASDAAADPSRVTMQIDNRTGQVSKVYRNPDFESGRQFNLGANAGTVEQMEKAVGKQGMVQSVNGMLDSIAAAAPEENQAAAREQFIAVASNPAARAAFLASAKAAGKDVQALTRQFDLVKTYLPASGEDKPGKDEREFTAEEKAAAKKFGADPDAESIYSKAGKATRGMFQGLSNAFSVPTEAFVKNTAGKINATGKIEQGDAKALAAAFKANPPIMSLFTPEQISAIRVISREQF